MKRMWILWIFAILITILTAIYQRITGPTYPMSINIALDNKNYKFKLPRSNEGEKNAEIILNIPDTILKAKLFYRHYPANEQYESIDFERENQKLIAKLPVVPPAGKLQYYIEIKYGNEIKNILKEQPVVIRYRADVPGVIMIPHIILMFLAMLISNLSGLMVIFKKNNLFIYSVLTFALLVGGGIILGCFVQKFAFNEYWTGIPFGWDLTDNKTLVAVVVWLAALILNRKKDRPVIILIASIILLLIYSIPHSLYGSELNYTSGTISQG